MKQIFEIKDKNIINKMMSNVEYGTLALCNENIPYSVAVNFVHEGNSIYFHGSQSGRKMQTIKANPKVSFSIVENFSIIASYFSSTDKLACPATQFFKSISIDGEVSIVEEKEEKRKALTLLMQKLQPEGQYRPFSDLAYDKMLKATAVLKIDIKDLRAKFKFGQQLDKKRFEMIISHLEERSTDIDQETIQMMKEQRIKDDI
ncbi:MAG: nitroimidazol reductase NimA-like FMN-containing flavoprotein [Sulfurimonas sp.]|jgi:nitroimidazol reductase NimA-like FMN-containing flavoprotein (pyridoxamine 5'-phosphate oxidase superfamily)